MFEYIGKALATLGLAGLIGFLFYSGKEYSIIFSFCLLALICYIWNNEC